MRRLVAMLAASALLSGASAVVAPAGASAGSTGSTTRVSIASDGTQGNLVSRTADVSGDGRFVAFESAASTLVASDTNGVSDVFVRDRQSGTTTRVSVATGGVQANGASDGASISRDGRWVAFVSAASNLVEGDTNAVRDVFVHDRATTTTTRVSVTASGAQAGGISFTPQISGDGRYVAFHTFSDLAGTGAATGQMNAYRVDRTTGQVDDICVRWDGVRLRLCLSPAISDDGRYVAFEAQGKLAADDANSMTDVYLRDVVGATTTRVSVPAGGGDANDQSLAPSISAGGGVVAFTSRASDLVAGDDNAATDVFVRDLSGGTTERVSVGTAGPEPNGNSWTRQNGAGAGRTLSADGRYVVFHSFASNLVDPDANAGGPDVFLRDRAASTTLLASLSWDDRQVGLSSTVASVSADGRFVTFESSAAELVQGDTNGLRDVFIRDLRANTPPTLSLPADRKVHLADGLDVSGSFTDPDVDQDWRGTVTYSAGGSPVALELQPDKTFALVHLYPEIGVYVANVALTDGAGGSATGSFTVTVEPTPVTYADPRAGMSIAVQLDTRASDHGRVWFTIPGTGTYTFDAAASMRSVSGTTVLIDHAGSAVLESVAGTVALSVGLHARLDPGRHIGEATLTDSEGRRFQVVARP